MGTTASPAGDGCRWPRCFPASIFQLLQPGDGEIHKQPSYWLLIGPLMLCPGLVSVAVLSQQCAKCSPKEHNDIIPVFSQQFSLHLHLFRPPFHRETLWAVLPYPFISRFLWTSFTPTFQRFLVPIATPFLSSIFSFFFWQLPPVVVWSLQQSFFLTLPA